MVKNLIFKSRSKNFNRPGFHGLLSSQNSFEKWRADKIRGNVRGALSKVTTRYRKEFPKLKLETQGTEGEIEMLRIVYPLSWTIWNFRTISMSHRGWRRTSVFYRESLIGKNPCIKFAFERVAARKNWDWKENVSNHFRLCRRTTSSIAIRTHVKRVRLLFYPFHLDSDHRLTARLVYGL